MGDLLWEVVILAGFAVVWWVPTFRSLTDLQRRDRVPRVLVWKWTAVLCVPVLGAWLYEHRGRAELDGAARAGRG